MSIISEMNDEIQSKITVNMKDEEFNQVKLKYKDILLIKIMIFI